MWNKGTILEKYLDDMRFWKLCTKIFVFLENVPLSCAYFCENFSFLANSRENMRKTGTNACGRMKKLVVFATIYLFSRQCSRKQKVLGYFLRKVSRDRNEWQNLTKTKRNFAVSRKFKNEFSFQSSCKKSVFCNLWCSNGKMVNGKSKDWGRVAYDVKSSAYCGNFMNLLI